MRRRIFAALLAAAMSASMAVPASALLKENAGAAAKQQTDPAPKAAAGAFIGSTELARYLYEKFSSNPSSLSVPVSLFSSQDTQERFNELGDAAIEAYLQNGLTDYVVDFAYHYNDGASEITMDITYSNGDGGSRQAQAQALDRKASEIVGTVARPEMTQRQKAEALSNYVAQNVVYDFESFRQFQAGQNVYELQTASAALVGGKAICQGFARAYKLLCDKAGIPCVVIFGTTRQFGTTHAWCRVNVDGKWETVDASNPQLAINHVGSFAIPADVVAATLIPDGSKTLTDGQAAKYLA